MNGTLIKYIIEHHDVSRTLFDCWYTEWELTYLVYKYSLNFDCKWNEMNKWSNIDRKWENEYVAKEMRSILGYNTDW